MIVDCAVVDVGGIVAAVLAKVFGLTDRQHVVEELLIAFCLGLSAGSVAIVVVLTCRREVKSERFVRNNLFGYAAAASQTERVNVHDWVVSDETVKVQPAEFVDGITVDESPERRFVERLCGLNESDQ